MLRRFDCGSLHPVSDTPFSGTLPRRLPRKQLNSSSWFARLPYISSDTRSDTSVSGMSNMRNSASDLPLPPDDYDGASFANDGLFPDLDDLADGEPHAEPAPRSTSAAMHVSSALHHGDHGQVHPGQGALQRTYSVGYRETPYADPRLHRSSVTSAMPQASESYVYRGQRQHRRVHRPAVPV